MSARGCKFLEQSENLEMLANDLILELPKRSASEFPQGVDVSVLLTVVIMHCLEEDPACT